MMVMITLYARQQKRHRCMEWILDSEGEEEGGMMWENGIETCILSCKKQIASLCLMQDTGCLGLLHRDDLISEVIDISSGNLDAKS